MATKAENFEDPNSCWSRADDDEQLFVFRQRDRHAPALIRLWAEMREKEGEDLAIVNEAREVAGLMEDAQTAEDRVTLSLDAVAAFCVTLKQAPVPVTEYTETPTAAPADPYNLIVGEVVVAGRGRPAKLVRIFGNSSDIDEKVRGMANIQVPGFGPVTVQFATLRRAQPDEVEAFRNTGGRL
jgi:hypothetical protein